MGLTSQDVQVATGGLPIAPRRRAAGPRVRVKICGVTTVDDALAAVDLGADFLGLNFHPPSPRHVTDAVAREIVTAVRQHDPTVELVGVFVEGEPASLARRATSLGLDRLQFHGEVRREAVAPFDERSIKVFRVREHFDPTVLAAWQGVWGFLIDTLHPMLHGGSGLSWDFASLRDTVGDDVRLFIAGGLNPANVAAALLAARPWGLDLCSGVESVPGRKDPELLRQLFEEIHHGESLLAS